MNPLPMISYGKGELLEKAPKTRPPDVSDHSI
jgi:hypothetical protein